MHGSTIMYFTLIYFLHASVELPFVLSRSSEDELFVLWKHSTEIESVSVGEGVVGPHRSTIREQML